MSFLFLPFIVPAAVAFLSALLFAPITIFFMKRFSVVDDPRLHKHPAILHKKPIPRGGGIPLFLGVLVAAIVFLPLTKTTVALYIACALALCIGVLDDKLDISPYLRFGVNILTALIIVGSGVSIAYITNPLGGILEVNSYYVFLSIFGISFKLFLSDILALFWLVWVMNMLNWSKGVDGQMPGVVAISAIFIGILSIRFPLTEQNTLIAATLSFIICGSCLGFLPFNFYPAKIFPGYGATSIYLLLGAVSILSGAKLATAILVMGVPMVDGLFTVLRRLLSGRSPFWHDNKHLHHLLLRLGFSQRTVALCYWIFSAILGAISLQLDSKGKLFALIMLGVVVGGSLLFLHLLLSSAHEKETV